MFNMIDLIDKKKRGKALTGEEIDFFVRGSADGSLPDYQLSALLMAICLRGMDEQETARLTGLPLLWSTAPDFVDLGADADRFKTVRRLVRFPWE